MPRTLFTAENAAEMARRSHAPGSARFAIPPAPAPAPPEPQPTIDPFVAKLAQAQEEKLDALLKCKDPKECASLAQALRNLRETYHLVTGEFRPGVRRDGRRRGPRAALPFREVAQQPQPSAEDKRS